MNEEGVQEKKQVRRWSWKNWQALVREQITDQHARRLAEVWPTFAQQQPGKKRGMWAHEMTYQILPDWTMHQVIAAANILEEHGLASCCPIAPLYVPTLPIEEGGQCS